MVPKTFHLRFTVRFAILILYCALRREQWGSAARAGEGPESASGFNVVSAALATSETAVWNFGLRRPNIVTGSDGPVISPVLVRALIVVRLDLDRVRTIVIPPVAEFTD